MDKKFPCPCCGYFTLSRQPPGTFELCPVCYWEDDPVQFENPSYEGGANHPSLSKGRENFKIFGACEESAVKYVRKPFPEETP